MTERYADKQIKLFSLTSNLPIAEKISKASGIPLGKISSRQFSDGEIMINIEETVRGDDLYIIQSTSFPVNDNLWELLIMIDACKRASANTVNIVLPYFGYSRQDRVAKSREPITAKLVANMLTKAGIDRVVTLDLHAVQVQGFFDIPVDNLFTVPLFAEHYSQLGLAGADTVVVSPKNSGIKRARSLAEYLDSPIAIIDYAQDDSEREEGYVIGDVSGKKAILIDDILNTGKTFAEAAKILERAGATDIYAVASHGLFAGGAADVLETAPIKEIIVTDSVKTKNRVPENVTYLSASDLIAEAIIRIHERKPLSPLFSYKPKRMIYFDNAATTPLSPSVITVMTETMTDVFGNPSSIHSYGRQASKTLRESRQTIANLLDVNARHIIFTSGGTESNNTAIKGYALANQNKGNHLITTAIEHHSVLHTMAYLEDRFGFEVTYLPCQNGTIDLADVKKALRDDTILVSMMYANNETGDVLPIQEIGNLLRDHQAVFHVDAVQAIGKFDIFPEQLEIDFLSASAHKFHGPKGVGFLYSKGMIMDSLLHGGEQEHKRRASTENLPGIVGMAQALKDALTNCLSATNHITSLRDHLLEQLDGLSYYLNQGPNSLPQVINIGFPGYQNGVLLTQLDLAGFAVSTGSACTAGTVEPSHVLAAYYGKESHRLAESIRISLSDQNTFEEVTQLAQTLRKILGESDGI